MSRRVERVADLLRVELSELLHRELDDPRSRLAVIGRIEVSPDLRHARIAVSALGSEPERAAAVAALNHARGFLRSRLAGRLRLRAVPDLEFHLDRGAEHSERISRLLEELGDVHDEDS
ncbi:MAG: 30S ribosome-binding factor RbfA [Thermoanaerobaculia bacterium]|nr:30S ribosome-binding factor RbfA [Thermoanaerobaculia bacterium]MBP7813375.1 30S ribosome-binding factor RbfA [Thermoanaerobaculia bacterium]MBP8846267.1 30S ribosome-binding factor RbfA [Thermoanaerobaculia bacterium]MDI9632071.1 30S ribosome-binding factor RbfA [Acidobacteriota bacterium]